MTVTRRQLRARRALLAGIAMLLAALLLSADWPRRRTAIWEWERYTIVLSGARVWLVSGPAEAKSPGSAAAHAAEAEPAAPPPLGRHAAFASTARETVALQARELSRTQETQSISVALTTHTTILRADARTARAALALLAALDDRMLLVPEISRPGALVRHVALSLWPPFCICVLVGAVVASRWKVARAGCCAECGYDLRGNVSGRCPEGGTDVADEPCVLRPSADAAKIDT